MCRENSFKFCCRFALFIYLVSTGNVSTTGYTKALDEKNVEPKAKPIPAIKRHIGDYPYLVALLYGIKTRKDRYKKPRKYRFFCSGTIISKDYVVTAASCLVHRNPRMMFISAGSNDFSKPKKNDTIIGVNEFFVHPEFDLNSYKDIAVLEMRHEMTLSGTIQPVLLTPKNKPLKEDSIVFLSGWGRSKEHKSRKMFFHVMVADVPVVNNRDCWDAYNKEYGNESETMWCSGHYQMGDDIHFEGDHGAPAVHKGILFGVVSGKHHKKRELYPAFTNIALPPIRNFIKSRARV